MSRRRQRRYYNQSWEELQRRRMGYGDVAPLDLPFSEYERQEPVRAPSAAGDLLVPAGQALISGVVVMALGLATLPVAGGNWRWAIVAGAAVTAVVWFTLLSDSRQLLRITERVIGIDEERPEQAPEPDPKPAPFRIEITQKHNKTASRVAYIDLPEGITHETMADVATVVLGPSGSVSRPYLCDERSLLTQTQYNQLRKQWIGAGLLVAMPGNRTELTAAGRSVLKAYRDQALADEGQK